MTERGCACVEAETARDERLAVWRDVCTKFFYETDPRAKQVLEYFESTSVDQVVIQTETGTPEEAAIQDLVTRVGLLACAIPDHQTARSDWILALERVKNDVRKGYHQHIARQKYQEFDTRVRARQSTNYELVQDDSGIERLVLRALEAYVRSADAQAHTLQQIDSFVHEFGTDFATHPFFAGLHQVLMVNATSATVTAWKMSDAVLVESGPRFVEEALKLLVNVLNFGHQSPGTPSSSQSSTVEVRSRLWLIDPYMSDAEILSILKHLPPAGRLQARPTDSVQATDVPRPNARGEHDEQQSFFQRWCVIL
ncbi:hypothetical protein Poli38472_009129 [Pythium oligandrum]|uniref:Uncharacterized protein n=1 Tax=Pythium oligandrum TaxID=41045 RepID=A0A8K1CMA9_PYTOL|nr:hypothetical protein Poli38472_009129 [Pythium oligandrum]|eukprot:TMW64962.1 hypothetical protein Poli38472_009129 [Pythium oligandrum]